MRYRHAVTSTINPVLGQQPLGKITTDQIARFPNMPSLAVPKSSLGGVFPLSWTPA